MPKAPRKPSGTRQGPRWSASLDPEPNPVDSVTVHFQTPTELKTAGGLAERPEFPIIFGRLRDRISTLRALYGAGPLDIDFKGLGERAARIALRSSEYRLGTGQAQERPHRPGAPNRRLHRKGRVYRRSRGVPAVAARRPLGGGRPPDRLGQGRRSGTVGGVE